MFGCDFRLPRDCKISFGGNRRKHYDKFALGHRLAGSVTRIVVVNHVTLDGVVQGPGRAEEDTTAGAEANPDDVLRRAWGEEMSGSGGVPAEALCVRGSPRFLEHPGESVPRGAQRRSRVRLLHHVDRAPAVAQFDAAR
ncbi:hypothetical protein SAMN04487904_101450 [Actinopolyspora lacussalsi subsp. righensis]|uniref:Uncharacterized protein n=1 Tax=Actinopolyspora righensis TaxID=995060 RepID=A0A1I6XBV8_9ACTN|nr:hypothetical protein SAMN04487904_101450 [Actinopolyspora righensis]